jgi:hypothetical protein
VNEFFAALEKEIEEARMVERIEGRIMNERTILSE